MERYILNPENAFVEESNLPTSEMVGVPMGSSVWREFLGKLGEAFGANQYTPDFGSPMSIMNMIRFNRREQPLQFGFEQSIPSFAPQQQAGPLPTYLQRPPEEQPVEKKSIYKTPTGGTKTVVEKAPEPEKPQQPQQGTVSGMVQGQQPNMTRLGDIPLSDIENWGGDNPYIDKRLPLGQPIERQLLTPPPSTSWSSVYSGQPPIDYATESQGIAQNALPPYQELQRYAQDITTPSNPIKRFFNKLADLKGDRAAADQAGVMQYELNRRKAIADLQMNALNTRYQKEWDERSNKLKFQEQVLNTPGGDRFRNNEKFMADMARGYGVSEKEIGSLIDGMKDPTTGKFSFVLDKTEIAKNELARDIGLYRQLHPGMADEDYLYMSLNKGQMPEYATDLMKEATLNIYKARKSGDPIKIKEAENRLAEVQSMSRLNPLQQDLKFLAGIKDMYLKNKDGSFNEAGSIEFAQMIKDSFTEHLFPKVGVARIKDKKDAEPYLKQFERMLRVQNLLDKQQDRIAQADTPVEKFLKSQDSTLKRKPNESDLTMQTKLMMSIIDKVKGNMGPTGKPKSPTAKVLNKDEIGMASRYGEHLLKDLGGTAKQELNSLLPEETVLIESMISDKYLSKQIVDAIKRHRQMTK